MPSDIHSDASLTNAMIMKVPAPDPSVHYVLLGLVGDFNLQLGIQCPHARHAVLVSHFVVSPEGLG